jgi:hypothetical protein
VSGPQFDDEEEQLPQSPRRLRTELLVGAGVLVAVVLIGKALAGRNGGPSHPSPSPSVLELIGPTVAPTTPAVPAPSSVLITRADGERLQVPALPPRSGSDPARCPARVSCLSQDAGNASVLDAVLARVPAARTQRFRSVRLMTNPWAGQLWYRELEFTLPGGQLEITVAARRPDARPDRGQLGNRLYLRTTVQQYEVTMSVPASAGVKLDVLQQIAVDNRLLLT